MPAEREPGKRALRGRGLAPGLLLAALGAWAVVVPYLGPAIGLRLDVASKLEFVDHVVPGAVAVMSGALLVSLLARGGGASSPVWLGAAAVAFLAGLWVVSTHVPLLADADRGNAEWGPALLHNSAGLPILLLSLWLLFEALRPTSSV